MDLIEFIHKLKVKVTFDRETTNEETYPTHSDTLQALPLEKFAQVVNLTVFEAYTLKLITNEYSYEAIATAMSVTAAAVKRCAVRICKKATINGVTVDDVDIFTLFDMD